MKNLLAQINANPRLRNLGLVVLGSGLILAFPSSIAWLPEETGKMVWNGANDAFKMFIGLAILFGKQSNNTGVPKSGE